MKRKVYLEGEIGEKFGREFTMDVDSFADAVKCLDCNFPGFREYMIKSEDKGIGFLLEVEDTPLTDEKEICLSFKEKGDFTISAVPTGSRKSSVGKIILGAILMYISYTTGIGADGTWLANFGFALGTNLVLTGIQEVLAPDPSVDNDQDESYLFQGAAQALIEGDPVPVLYGELRVPGRPISFQQITTPNNGLNPGDDNPDNPLPDGTQR